MKTPEEILEHIKIAAPDIHREITSRLGRKAWADFLGELKRVEPKSWFRAVHGQLNAHDYKNLWGRFYCKTTRWGRINTYSPKIPQKKKIANAKRIIIILKGRPPDKFRPKDIRKEKRRAVARERFERELAVTYQGEKRWTYGFDTRRFSMDINRDWVRRIESHPAVASIEVDKRCYVMAQTVPYGISKVGALSVHLWNKGTGIKVCVIDTGVDYTHPDLTGRYVSGRDFVNNDYDPMDDHGHGTHCAGTICATDNTFGVIGVAPEAALYACKVLNNKGSGSLSDVAAGVDWAKTNGMDVVSMSLGGPYSSTLEAACIAAKAAGVVLCAAAGNSGPCENTCGYPGRLDSTICVGATDAGDNIAGFSSRCPEMTVSAPGVGVYSTTMGGGYGQMSGTSMACPHVAGCACLLKASALSDTPDQIEQKMIDNAVDLGSVGHDTAYGWGRIDVSNAIIQIPSTTVAKVEIVMGKESAWSFHTELHPAWSLKSLVSAIGVIEFSFLTGLAPSWTVKSEIEAINIVGYSFSTEPPPPEFLKTVIKVQHSNPTWKFWTQLPNKWCLKSCAEAKKYFEYSFGVEFDPATERKDFPEIELWRPEFTAPTPTVFFNWIKKGVPKDINFELWYGNRQYLEESDIVVGARAFGAAVGHGYDLVTNGYFQVAFQGGSFTPITDTTVFNAGSMSTNSKKDVTFRLLIPGEDLSAGIVFFEIVLAKQREFKYQDKMYNEGIFGREYIKSAGTIIARAHILP